MIFNFCHTSLLRNFVKKKSFTNTFSLDIFSGDKDEGTMITGDLWSVGFRKSIDVHEFVFISMGHYNSKVATDLWFLLLYPLGRLKF